MMNLTVFAFDRFYVLTFFHDFSRAGAQCLFAGRSTSNLYCKSSEQNKTAKVKKYQRDDISKQLSRAFWKS